MKTKNATQKINETEELGKLTFFTVNQAAAYLQLSPKTLWTHTKRGLLPSIRVGGLVRYRRQALDETLAKWETRPSNR
ncbi:helix-turn-helix domain-containing protein [bacterium]|jgi:excisionase family DNA binding protein|nr:helix-turn-helix domain-containing protein [Verrucomicrobiota bacterium]MDA7500192.1 helix-turn-helix domain-containing protein [bacterium]MDA7645604.1 helix-turn-helix domain-containing protein [bacterium]